VGVKGVYDRVLRIIFGAQAEIITGDCRKMQNELHDAL